MNWLQPLLTTFYSPNRGMAMVRDRAPLGQAIIVALLVQGIYLSITQALFGGGLRLSFNPVVLISSFSQSGYSLIWTMLAFVPSTLFVGNLIERRSSAMLAIREEYAPLAACVLVAIAVSSVIALPLAILVHVTGFDIAYVNSAIQTYQPLLSSLPPQLQTQFSDPRVLAQSLYGSIPFPFYAVWVVIAVRAVFRVSLARAVVVTLLGAVVMVPVMLCLAVLITLLGPIISSPLLLLLLFFYLRGYFSDVAKTQRSRMSFRQNLEAATLNPADASAHYNLGLLHLQRKELEEAKQRFERAVKIDPEEVDAHYQLGRIARMQNRLSDAIANFTEVVTRDDRHSQHEIWREIGETYLAAGQYEDARDALERFLDRRQSDPQGLYLMGRAQAGLGLRREADASMQACIEAVKTSPDYKYRTEKQWLNLAREFVKKSSQESGVRSQ
jgi:tetratricopeptide (TPR) repeat protein